MILKEFTASLLVLSDQKADLDLYLYSDQPNYITITLDVQGRPDVHPVTNGNDTVWQNKSSTSTNGSSLVIYTKP